MYTRLCGNSVDTVLPRPHLVKVRVVVTAIIKGGLSRAWPCPVAMAMSWLHVVMSVCLLACGFQFGVWYSSVVQSSSCVDPSATAQRLISTLPLIPSTARPESSGATTFAPRNDTSLQQRTTTKTFTAPLTVRPTVPLTVPPTVPPTTSAAPSASAQNGVLTDRVRKMCMGASSKPFPEPVNDDKWSSKIPRVLHYIAPQPRPGAESAWERHGLTVAYHTDSLMSEVAKELDPELVRNVFPVLSRIEKVDVFRYVLMQHCGGFYADQDVTPERQVVDWLKVFNLHDRAASADFLMGMEFTFPPDKDGGHNSPVLALGGNSLPFELCQWTFAFARFNPLIGAVIDLLKQFATRLPAGNPVMRTGPGMFTGAVLQFLAGKCGHIPSHKLYPKCILPIDELEKSGQMLSFEHDNRTHFGVILPYRAFGFHAMHRDPTNRTPLADHLVRHWFEGSWRKNP